MCVPVFLFIVSYCTKRKLFRPSKFSVKIYDQFKCISVEQVLNLSVRFCRFRPYDVSEFEMR